MDGKVSDDELIDECVTFSIAGKWFHEDFYFVLYYYDLLLLVITFDKNINYQFVNKEQGRTGYIFRPGHILTKPTQV